VELAGRKITTYGVALFCIVLIGAFLRFYHLGTQSLWYDEAFSVWISKLSVPQLVQATEVDVHPPFYYLLLHYWTMLFGTSESAVRLLSALFGILAIPMIYVVGRQLFNREAGLAAAIILAFSTFNIAYSQETRMYSLMVLLALISMYFFIRLLDGSNYALSIGYLLSTTLLIYTHIYGLFVVIAQNLFLVVLSLLSKNHPYSLKSWAKLQAIVVVFFIPWIAVLVKQIPQREAAISPVQFPTTQILIETFSNYSGTGALLLLFLGFSVLSLFAFQKVRGKMDRKAPLKALESYSWQVTIQSAAPVFFLVIWLLSINLIPFIISSFSAPIYLERYTITASVALYLLVAKGISNINHKYTKLAVIGIIVVLSVANLQVYYSSVTKSQMREAAALIDANFSSGDVVLIAPYWENLTFDYYNNRTDVAVKPIYSWAVADTQAKFWATPSWLRPENKIKEIHTDVNGRDRVWFVTVNIEDGKAAENFTLNILNESYANVYKTSYYYYDVYLFEKNT